MFHPPVAVVPYSQISGRTVAVSGTIQRVGQPFDGRDASVQVITPITLADR